MNITKDIDQKLQSNRFTQTVGVVKNEYIFHKREGGDRKHVENLIAKHSSPVMPQGRHQNIMIAVTLSSARTFPFRQ